MVTTYNRTTGVEKINITCKKLLVPLELYTLQKKNIVIMYCIFKYNILFSIGAGEDKA